MTGITQRHEDDHDGKHMPHEVSVKWEFAEEIDLILEWMKDNMEKHYRVALLYGLLECHFASAVDATHFRLRWGNM